MTESTTATRRLVRSSTTVIVWLAIGGVIPHLVGTGPNKLNQLNYILALMMVASGLNIVLGFAGQLFLGPSALLAAGAYAAAILAKHFTALQSLPAMCLIAIAAAVLLGAIAAVPALRIGGFYLGMVTLFAALVVPHLASRLTLTGGSSGISLLTVSSFAQHPHGVALYNVGLLLVALMAGYAWIIKHSRLGRRFGAIMASEELAQSVGIPPYQTKLVSFMLAAVPCGVAGAFYVYSQQFISPDSVSPTLSITILAGMVIGGGGTILGPLIGTALVGAASQFLGSFEKYQGLVYGLALIGVATGLPVGLMGLYQQMLLRARAWRGASGQALSTPSDVLGAAAIPVPNDTDRAGQRASPPLVVRGVSRSFGGVRALDGVDLVVEPGRIHALVGPNGSGKTTLLNVINGFYRADEGSIELGDQRLDSLRAPQIAGLGVARTFQTPKLLVANTAIDNVLVAADRAARGSLVGAVLHTPTSRAADRDGRMGAATALQRAGLIEASYTMAELIPHGTQRLLEMARAMALKPTFVLLDEPAAGLSAAEAELLTEAVRAMAAADLGVLIVEHNLPVVLGLADVVTVLHQGRVIANGTPSTVIANPEVIRVYLGRQRDYQERASSGAVRPVAGSAEPRP
jgi:ABC-type branched-subunit amino acid transport system ATPase component/ABC-type branched-subunit amino acid transport system permease subunit